MTNTDGNISVVICAYTEERWSDLVSAVESIQLQTTPPRETIIVIDHNIRLLERARMLLSEVLVVENHGPRGLSGARNTGIALSLGSLIAFLDDDAVAEPDWLARLESGCQNPYVLGVGGVVKPLWSDKRPVWFPEEFYWVVGCTYRVFPNTTTVVRNPYGGCTCIRREVFETVGGFRKELGRRGAKPLGGEETELCIRAKQYWPEKFFLCEPRAIIHHRIPPQRSNWKYFVSRCYSEGLSKAAVARYIGAREGLSSERAYTLHTLPHAMLRSMRDGLSGRDLTGFLRAGAMASGLMLTIAGYLIGIIYMLISSSKKEVVSSPTNFKRLLHHNSEGRTFILE